MAQETAERLRVLMIGAHPDDCEIDTGGVATKYRARGDVVKFVPATNGDAGHHQIGGGPLARRRREQTRRVAKVADIKTRCWKTPMGGWRRTSPPASSSSGSSASRKIFDDAQPHTGCPIKRLFLGTGAWLGSPRLCDRGYGQGGLLCARSSGRALSASSHCSKLRSGRKPSTSAAWVIG